MRRQSIGLTNPANGPLKKLSDAYSAKFEAFKKQGMIRVEADLYSSEVVVQMLMHILENVKSTNVSTDALKARADTSPEKVLNDAFVEEIERLTNTVIFKPARQGSDANREVSFQVARAALPTNAVQYTVYYLGPEESDLEDARRLLTMETNKDLTKHKGDLFIQVSGPSTTSAVPMDFGQNLPLVARSTQWARLVDTSSRHFDIANTTDGPPIEKPLDTFTNPDLVVDTVTRFLTHRELMRYRKKVQQVGNQHWETTLTRKSQVVLGQLAFPLQQAQKVEAKLQKSNTAADMALNGVYKSLGNLQRAFVTTVPRMTRALEAVPSSTYPLERLLIRMVPTSAPGLRAEIRECIPELEIIMRINPAERKVDLRNVRLVLMHQELDLLLPSHTTDLRFISRSYLHGNREGVDPCLTAFVEASQLDIWRSERLRTPNTLRLSIPTASISKRKGHAALPDRDVVTVEYQFAGLEHRSHVNLIPVGNKRAQYNTIEAGRIGGRREELTINLRSLAGSSRNLSDREVAKGLLESALAMIGSIG